MIRISSKVATKARGIIRRSSLAATVAFQPSLNSIYARSTYAHHVLSFSQEGEDLMLDRFFPNENSGFYVDVGAHHPSRFSNTYRLYLKGWSGINIEPSERYIADFKRMRPRDIHVQSLVSDFSGDLEFVDFSEGAMSGIQKTLPTGRQDSNLVRSVQMLRPRTLTDIVQESLPKGLNIDLLTIDVEGHEMGVLRSNDWTLHRPRVIIVEDVDFARVPLQELLNKSDIHRYLSDQGYILRSKLDYSTIYAVK